MKRHGVHVIALLLAAGTLTACGDAAPPPPTPSGSPTPSASATPSASPEPLPTSTPTLTPLPPDEPPQRVVGLTATEGGGSGEVLLMWTPNPESDIDHYIVMRSDTPGGPRIRVGTMTPEEVAMFPIRPFVDYPVSVGYYRVRAVDSADQQGHSSEEVCGAAIGYSC